VGELFVLYRACHVSDIREKGVDLTVVTVVVYEQYQFDTLCPSNSPPNGG